MVSRKMGRAALITALIFGSENVFHVSSFTSAPAISISNVLCRIGKAETPIVSTSSHPSVLLHARGDDSVSADDKSGKIWSLRHGKIHHAKSILKPASLAILTAGLISHRGAVFESNPFVPLPSHASAPIVPFRNHEVPDIKEESLKKATEAVKNKKEYDAEVHRLKCEEIEAESGKSAREAYDAEYVTSSKKREEEKVIQGKQLYYDLADQGICPYTDVEGERQITLHEKGFDLDKVSASDQQQEQMSLTRPKFAVRRAKQRFLVKCIVEDLKLKGEDPVKYLESNKRRTLEIFDYSDSKLDAITSRYKAAIAERGSLSGIMAETPFDSSTVIYGVGTKDTSTIAKEANIAAKMETARLKGEEREANKIKKAAAKAEKARIKAEAKLAKEEAKAEAKATKEAAKTQAIEVHENDVKAAEIATEIKTIGTTGAEENELMVAEATAEIEVTETSEVNQLESDTSDESISMTPEVTDDEKESAIMAGKNGLRRIPVAPIVTVFGGVGGGVAFKVFKDKSTEAENERQRQFKLLMGTNDDDDDDNDHNDDNDETDGFEFDMTSLPREQEKGSQKSESIPKPTPVSAPPKKRRMGLSSVFSKKTSNRETELAKLMEPSAAAPAFATLLAKILSFGAPGRFPVVENLPDSTEMEEFDLEKAKTILTESCENLNLTNEVSAEVFASVVNCMIIDIIDLASSSLGGKDPKQKLTVDGLNVVMDFMDHAASLFDAVAAGIQIVPVTYGGNLGKKKLEEMFTIYASSIMTSLDGSVTQDRVDTLQQVFNINDKKAEGLLQKGMMKNMMSMMKEGGGEGMEGMEGLSELLGGGGLEGMPGVGEGDVSEEDLKQSVTMMKELVESGSVSKDELDLIRQQFKEMYGSDINELITAADEEGAEELTGDGKELLDIFKTILKEDE